MICSVVTKIVDLSRPFILVTTEQSVNDLALCGPRRERMSRNMMLVLGVALTLWVGCSSPAPNGAESDGGTDTVVADSGLPPCEDGKEDGVTCDPDADAGTDAGSPTEDGGTDAADSSTTDTEVSDDAEVTTTDEGAPPVECPPAAIPNGTYCPGGGCRVYWQQSGGQCLSDCEGVISPPRPLERISVLCGL